MIHSFLMIGQSNMAGRGKLGEVPPIENPGIKVLRNGRWQKMYVPVNCDRPFSGVSLAESFADLYQKQKGVDVGLIPCADGGTSLEQWQPGSLLYDHTLYQARLAMRTSTIAGVLWHQGERDCCENVDSYYEEKLSKIFEALRRDLDLYDVPFLVGGLGDFLVEYEKVPESKFYYKINNALQHYAATHPMTGYVSSRGLTCNSDHLHFCSASLREFGARYFAEFLKLENLQKVFLEKPSMDDALRTQMELL